MTARRAGVVVALALAVAVVAAASHDPAAVAPAQAASRTLTIYSSLPLRGTSRAQSQAVVRGERLALRNVSSKVGGYRLRFVSLDDSTAANPGTADARQTARNARRAAKDKTAILYLGEFNSGGTKISLPILNQAGIPQISPSNTYVGLTSDAPGSEAGEPGRYYPAGTRTYARILPNDRVQGAALATLMREDGCTSATLWNDGDVYGRGVAASVKAAAPAAGLTIENEHVTDRSSPNYRQVAASVATPCFAWTGVTANNAVQVFADVAAAAPDARLYGSDGIAEASFTNPRRGGIPASVAPRVKLTVATVAVKDLPRARSFVRRYKKAYKTRSVDPYAVYGYETMTLALNALKRAGANAGKRSAVRDALFATSHRKGVIGTYSIDADGDTTLRDYGVFVIRGGLPAYSAKITATG